MSVGTVFDCGDLVLVPVPFSDLSAVKQRPVVVMTPRAYMETSGGDFVAVAVTSNPLERPYSLPISNEDLVDGELPKPSRVRVDKIFNLNRDQVRKRFGRLTEQAVAQVSAMVSRLLCEGRP